MIATLTAINARGHNVRPWLNNLAKALVQVQITNFATQGSLAGGWPPLSPEYGLWKATNQPGKPMMVSSGKLMRSVTRRDRLVQSMTNTSMRVGSDVHYAQFHQNGTRHMPQRKILVVPESVVKAMKYDLAAYIAKGKMRV